MSTKTATAVEQRLRLAPDSGALLEKAVLEGLRDFGAVEARPQLAGTQFGFDIWARVPLPDGTNEIWKLECKSLDRPIGLRDLAPKLIWHGGRALVDRFVIVSTSDPTNDLLHFLESQPYAFPIELWCGDHLFSLLASWPRALSSLGLHRLPVTPCHSPPRSFAAARPFTFDTTHLHDPPRQFAYLRHDDGSVLKAFTNFEFKLACLFWNRSLDDALIKRLVVRTRQYLDLRGRRVVLQTKMKGLFAPERILFSPCPVGGGEVDLLGEQLFSVEGHGHEALLVELAAGTVPGLYDLEFMADVASPGRNQRLAAPGVFLFVRGGGEDLVSLQTFGKHYDDPVLRILDLRPDDWQRVAASETPGQWHWIGPLPHEVSEMAKKPTRWAIRSQAVPGEDGVIQRGARLTVVLPGRVGEAIYDLRQAAERVSGSWAPSSWLPQQLKRRQQPGDSPSQDLEPRPERS